tara:strand:- start:2224 stop:3252 length:1029 start_codon:yes stop_codon:yes gene_type:complete
MIFKILVISISFLFLSSLVYFQKKFNFCLDKATDAEKHKNLLQLDNKVPLTGGFYFLPFIFFLIYQDNFYIFITSILFLFIGLLSDLKINSSPKLRLFFQSLTLLLFIFLNKNFLIDTRIDFLNSLIQNEFFRVLIISFFFLVLINGFNFIDGINNLCSLNIILILVFLLMVSKDMNSTIFINTINTLIFILLIFVIFNFFGKTFLGDAGVYILSFFLGTLVIKLSLLSSNISPYFIANLLWYPAFENLFSIIRRIISNKKNYIADNYHLHQLLFLFFQKKKIIKTKYLLSSFVGIFLNLYLLIFYFFGYMDYSDTKLQLYLILINTTIYLTIYYKLRKYNV